MADLAKYLSHGDGLVRDHALRSLALSGEHSGVDAGVALDAIAALGVETFAEPTQVRDLALAPETFLRLCDAHDRVAHPEIGRWLLEVPQDLLVAHRGRIGELRDAVIRAGLQRRLELQALSPEVLWQKLGESDDRAVLLALCAHDAFVAQRLRGLASGDARHGLLLEIAGHAHLGGALPLLLDAMGSQDDALANAAGRAIGRIGTAGAVTALEQRCDREGPVYRRRAAECLARMRIPSAETVLQRLLAQEDDPQVIRQIMQSLADLCTTQVFDRVLSFARGGEATAQLRQSVAALSIMLNRPAAEAPTWRGERRVSNIAFAQAFAPAPVKESGAAPAASMAKPEPLRSVAKLGRNDPCPCGSGRKYKKCCGA